MSLSSLLTRLSRDSGKHAFVSKQILFSLALIGVLTGCSPWGKIKRVVPGGDCLLAIEELPDSLHKYPISNHLFELSDSSNQIALVSRDFASRTVDTTIVSSKQVEICLLGSGSLPGCTDVQHAIDSVDTNPTKQAKWLNHWFADTTLTNSSPVSNPVDEEAKNQFLKNAGLGQHMRCTVSVQDSVVYVLTRGNGYERSMRRELPDTDLVTDTTNNIFLAHYAAVALANNAEFVERVTSDFAGTIPYDMRCTLTPEQQQTTLNGLESLYIRITKYYPGLLESYDTYCSDFSGPFHDTYTHFQKSYPGYRDALVNTDCSGPEVTNEYMTPSDSADPGLELDQEYCTTTASTSIVFSANCPQGEAHIWVVNTSGQQVCSQDIEVVSGATFDIGSCGTLPPGLYVVTIVFADGKTNTHKIVI